jgi:hypothetical protein
MRERVPGWVWGGLAAFAVTWLWVGLGPWRLGPSEWDDALYCNHAAMGRGEWYVRNRFVHIWSLRLAFAVVEPRAFAASLLSVLEVLGIATLGFLVVRRAAGVGAGLLALFLTPLYPPLCKYLSVPHVDITMALWSLCAIACALFAVDRASHDSHRLENARRALLVMSGLASFLAIESKETGLAAPPIVLYLLSQDAGPDNRPRWRVLGLWLAGATAGLCLLAVLDAAFKSPTTYWSSNPLEYFGGVPAAYAKAAVGEGGSRAAHRLNHTFLEVFTRPAYLAFSLLGLAGALHGFRRSLAVRALFLWWFTSTALACFAAWLTPNVEANDRYVIASGVALALLASYRVAVAWSGDGEATGVAQTHRPDDATWLAPTLLLLAGISVTALVATAMGHATDYDEAALLDIFPLSIVLAFLTPRLSRQKWLARAAVVWLLAASVAISFSEARAHVAKVQSELAPWKVLARASDAAGGHVAVLKSRHVPAARVLWRLRALSTLPASDTQVRKVASLEAVLPGELVFTELSDTRIFERAGYRAIASGGQAPDWTAYAPIAAASARR